MIMNIRVISHTTIANSHVHQAFNIIVAPLWENTVLEDARFPPGRQPTLFEQGFYSSTSKAQPTSRFTRKKSTATEGEEPKTPSKHDGIYHCLCEKDQSQYVHNNTQLAFVRVKTGGG